jgi:hypothetical protein
MTPPAAITRLKWLFRRHGIFLFAFLALAGPSIRPVLIGNEQDVLPYARHFVQPDWLKNDWYLSTRTHYRYAFNWIVGPALRVFPMAKVALAGRVFMCALFAWLIALFARRLRLPAAVLIPFLSLYAIRQSVAAGEWMTGGFETKGPAYLFAMLALYLALRRRYRLSSASLGLSLSFHVLVGTWAIFCLIAAYACDPWRLRRDGRAVASSLWLVLPFGAFGLYAIWHFLFPASALSPEQNAEAARIYVLVRNPHHVYPPALERHAAWRFAGVFAAFLAAAATARRREPRLLYGFVLASFVSCAIGFTLWETRRIELLRFYWFRFPDAAAPFLGMFVLALLVMRALRASRRRRWRRWSIVGVLAAATLAAGYTGGTLARDLTERAMGAPPAQTRAVSDIWSWVRKNTPPDSVILHSGYAMNCYARAERAQFFSFKHIPADPVDILEWNRRLIICNNGRPPLTRGFNVSKALISNFANIPPEKIRQIADEYNLDYYVGRAAAIPGGRLVYDNGIYRVHALRENR